MIIAYNFYTIFKHQFYFFFQLESLSGWLKFMRQVSGTD